MRKVIYAGNTQGDTKSLFGESLHFNIEQFFPLVTTRKVNYKAAFAELLCFTRGYTDVRSFQAEGVNFWNADCYKDSWKNSGYQKHEHDLGKIYGYQWVKGFGFNQIEELVKNLKENPLSRRHLLMTYNPADLKEQSLPPCYVSKQFYVRDGLYLDMMVHQRSADLCIGVPFDMTNFALLQTLIAKEVGLIPSQMTVHFGDVHVYKSHVENARIQMLRIPRSHKPVLKVKESASIFDFTLDDIEVQGYEPKESIKYKFEVQPK